MPEGIGRLLMAVGAVLIVVGALFTYGGRLFGLGRLPGDIVIQKGNFTFFFPIVTSILLSVGLTLVFWLISLLRR